MIYEILSASKDHSEEAVRAGVAAAHPKATIERVALNGDEWEVRIVTADDDDKPAFLDGGGDDDSKSDDDKPKDDKKDDSDSDKSEKKDDGEKSDKKKDDSGSVDKLRDLVQQLQQTMDEVVQNAEEVATDADGKQQKMEEIHDSVKEHVDGKDGEKGGDGDMPAPMPEDAIGLEDIGPTPGAPGAGGPPKPPMAPGGPKKPMRGMPPGAGPSGIPAFTNVQVAQHPGVDEKGERISLLAAASALETDPEFEEFEIVGMTENQDGTYSAKLKRKQ